MEPKPLFSALLTLHKYFIAANKMRIDFENALKRFDVSKFKDSPIAGILAFQADEPGIYMSYWYGGLYVVIEGWRELSLVDAAVDALLQSPNVELLRRYRNGTFHFQADYLNQKQSDFMAAKDTVPWVRDLTEAFSQFFLSRERAKKSTNA